MQLSALGWGHEERSEPRDAVHHRTRAYHADGHALHLVIVNTSTGGLMARCEAPCEPGDLMRVELPAVGVLPVEVRWSLGGRIGCRLVQPLAPERYQAMLAALRR